MQINRPSSYNWPILALLTFTGTFVAAVPVSCMPVLFKEISDDLGLNLVQLGTVWGIASFAGILVSVIGGAISDRFGARLVLGIVCLLTGITGALRGFSNSFFMLAAMMFLNGIVRLVIPVTVTKTVGIWYRGPKLGTAMGISAMGMGLGLLLGPLISATVVSPAVGGWRHVMYIYGAVSALFGILWFAADVKHLDSTHAAPEDRVSPRTSLVRLLKLKAIWLLGLTLLFRQGGMMGLTGYLPLYLRDKGWTTATADSTLSLFYAMSTALVVPLSLLSDKLGSRKAVLFPALLLTSISIALIPVAPDGLIWLLVAFAGAAMDGFMAILVTLLLETEGIGPKYSGMALGIVFTISQVGPLVSPALGNSFASRGAGLPFYFWAGLAVIAFVMFFFIRETGVKKQSLAK